MKLGINGLGRIGKLTLWHHIARKYFDEIVVNVGREVGTSFADIASYIEKDSTYGWLPVYLYGHKGKRVIENLDEKEGTMYIDGIKVKVLRTSRNPKNINWREEGVKLVVDCTGKFRDPNTDPEDSKGSIRGHFLGGAEKVILSAPFKIKDKEKGIPEDAITIVYGINEEVYQPNKHNLISAASCTTTCLAYMIKPLLDYFGVDRILSASMVTVHAATSSQVVLDRLPKEGAKDLRRMRSIFNNIILTTTGAAEALSLVIPEMKKVGFMAESVRVPLNTGSLIILTVNIQDESIENHIDRELINNIYKEAANTKYKDFLIFTTEQNVSSDIIGYPKAAAIIEGSETHTRTATAKVDICKALPEGNSMTCTHVEIPITQVVIYGWYDNELGSYTNMLGELTVYIAEKMI
ncbi:MULTISPECIES: glyceraldehyde 3-phosphate dehydrogenase NAD-binding domain-containing protein [Thermodesulfobacterium]|jgi:glyceraldehyde 3-phosphate dehydrogenase|uniref:Glyceraldehyde-3-phosphate dehydrogenase n=2 Tax=Thermodesulfobacterium commune TaxID=1741 RepID=A0A075WZ30_9BACT|nr:MULTISPECIES: glyceraldehyde 3-phosphate dehydrogenase NAD-binding domain-containing protein [Thermodesulfobacterium]KUJ96996.1 MAG: Glyceraldehyde-3-phosphate dehydrogenase (Phosphorylating) [Thermodesulfobacterium sp. 37_54]KUK38323.1 MAG: Glyceraldehyde-3-phosphate dehydrogenase (Phosphorylating) [Thermodesulfobacterium commune]AIH03932.1 glyceraldehyde-3-phosphate dehydrogenase [Thermodesulfobacterium commune DSM 2178]MBZ4681810.1 glyceraldehyde-3-phosphate dehydrogenase [Thermodesulfoba